MDRYIVGLPKTGPNKISHAKEVLDPDSDPPPTHAPVIPHGEGGVGGRKLVGNISPNCDQTGRGGGGGLGFNARRDTCI